MGGGDKSLHRETDRQTDRRARARAHTHTHTHTHTHRERERERERERQDHFISSFREKAETRLKKIASV